MTAILDAHPAQDGDTPATPVFAAPIRHPSAWTVSDFRSPADYSVDLDAAQLRDIAAAMRRIKAAGIVSARVMMRPSAASRCACALRWPLKTWAGGPIG